MPSLVVIGAQWGDEGKGKLVDYLTSNADCVVRFQGGNNAGHTLVVDGVKTKLSLVPSGILREKSRCLIGAGVVINPQVLRAEIEQLAQAGIAVTPARLIVDRDAQLIMAYHVRIDKAREVLKGDNKIGTTGRGIGPAYEDRAARCGVRVEELRDLPRLRERLEPVLQEKNLFLKHVLGDEAGASFDEEWPLLEAAAQLLVPHIGNASIIIDRAVRADERIVFEGAQGTLLDQIHGTVPFVTSSHTIAGAVTIGCGVGPKALGYILGVAKAYTTRVGSGPFPTEIPGTLGDQIREAGAEFGTVTGRPRRCGWFDAFAMRRAARLNGFDGIALTKLDVLSGLEKIQICIGYKLNGAELEDVPTIAADLARVEPRYIELDGWSEDLTDIKKWHELPAAARLYLSTIAEIIGCPVTIVSVGPERNSTLFSSGASFVKNFVR